MDVAIVVPFIVFASTALVIIAAFYFNHRNRRTIYDVIRVAIEKTGTVDAALVEAIIRDRVGPYADLRKGVILIAIAIAFMVLGFMVDDTEAVGPMLGVASFPGLVGVAYVLFHFFAPRERVV